MTLSREDVKTILTNPYFDIWTPQHQLGPDYIIPSDSNKTWNINGSVKIDVEVSGENVEAPVSIVTRLRSASIKYSNRVALAVQRNGVWIKWSFSEYYRDVCTVAKGFMKLGFLPRDGIAILGFNSPEWFMTHLGATFAGGFSVGIYATNTSETCFEILNDCSAKMIVVENEFQLEKILKIKERLPNLKVIIQYTGTSNHPQVINWSDLLLIGKSMTDEDLNRRVKGIAINECCCVVYTSGTTGTAKGVMLHHDNLCFTMGYLGEIFPLDKAKEIQVSYLPLSHVAALAGDLYCAMMFGISVYFATPDALKGKLVETLTEVQPTSMFGVPRVWEKMCEKIKDAQEGLPSGKKKLLSWAQNKSLAYNTLKYENANVRPPLGYKIADLLVLSKIRKMLGFSRSKGLISGGAPLSKELMKFFLGLGITLYECYGLSETAGPHLGNLTRASRFGSVGKAPIVQRIKIDNPNENGIGEILIKGRDIFMGYLNMEMETLEAKDDEGWFRTGDLGYLDENQFLFITGRAKEILITSGGENVAPVPIEDHVKNLLPVVSNCMVIGDKKKFLSMLITLKTEINVDTLLPTDTLMPAAVKWCQEHDCHYSLLSEILKAGPDPKVIKGIQDGIDEYNETLAISKAQRIQKWVILKQDFSVGGEELGPTLKLKRQQVMKKYDSLISDFYK